MLACYALNYIGIFNGGLTVHICDYGVMATTSIVSDIILYDRKFDMN